MPALLFVLAELLTALRVLRLLRIMRVWPGFRGAVYALRDGATTRPPTEDALGDEAGPAGSAPGTGRVPTLDEITICFCEIGPMKSTSVHASPGESTPAAAHACNQRSARLSGHAAAASTTRRPHTAGSAAAP